MRFERTSILDRQADSSPAGPGRRTRGTVAIPSDIPLSRLTFIKRPILGQKSILNKLRYLLKYLWPKYS